MQVPYFRYPHIFQQQREEILAAMIPVMERGAYINQAELQEFEKEIAAFVNAKHAIGVGNATDALLMALLAAGIRPGDEVLVPSHTFIATAAAVKHSGARPVLVDCGSDHLIDPGSAAASITARTRAIVPVQLNGRTANMDAIGALAHKHNLLIIEDSAQALGSKFKGKSASTFGAAGVFSFYPAKVLGCFGDGGVVITNDDEIARKVHLLRDHGRDATLDVQVWGFNSRLDNLHAAVMLVKLRIYPQEIERRREIARRYRARLQDIAELTLPPGPDNDPDHFDIYQNYEMESIRRDELRAYLGQNGVGTIIQWGGKAIHQFPALGFQHLQLPETDRLFQRCFMLPMNTSLTDQEVDYICDVIHRFFAKQA